MGAPQDGSGFKRFSFTVNYTSEKGVNEEIEALKKKGVKVVKEPRRTF